MNRLIDHRYLRSGQLVRPGADPGTVIVDPGNGGGTTPPVVSSYPGDPGKGNYYVGWSLEDGGSPPTEWNTTTVLDNPGFPGYSKVSVMHNYSSATRYRVDSGKLDAIIAKGLIPSQSFKMNGTNGGWTYAQVASGAADADIDYSAGVCLARSQTPIWLCYWHEPEDDVTTTQEKNDYRDAYRRIVTRFRAAGVTNVAWSPIYMNPYTFWGDMSPVKGGSPRHWKDWHPDWDFRKGGWYDDIMMDMMGMDTYSPINTGTTTHRYFDSMFNDMRSVVEKTGNPVWDYWIPEFGVSNRNDHDPVDWKPWFTTARDYAIANRIKAFCYWDNSDEVGRYGFGPSYDPNGTKLTGWNYVVNSPNRVKWVKP